VRPRAASLVAALLGAPSSASALTRSGMPRGSRTSAPTRAPGFQAPQEAARILGEAIDFARQGQAAALTAGR